MNKNLPCSGAGPDRGMANSRRRPSRQGTRYAFCRPYYSDPACPSKKKELLTQSLPTERPELNLETVASDSEILVDKQGTI